MQYEQTHKHLAQRLKKGLRFFRDFGERNWDSVAIKKYLPYYLGLVDEYLKQTAPSEPDTLKIEEVNEIFNGDKL